MGEVIPNALDPALRRPGRFDREIEIGIPDQNARLETMHIHTRGMPLDSDVDLERLSNITHGFVGADLEALCREAAMSVLRKLMPDIDFQAEEIPYETLHTLSVTMADFREAMKEVEPSAIREVFVEIPNTKWEDIGGLDNVKTALIEAVEWPIRYAQLFKQARIKPSKGILLAGPPGTGKTLVAKALANETEVNFISIKGPELMSKYVGESERGVREVFKKAKQASPCILFFDEIDSLVPSRGASGGDSQTTERVISQFLAELDGLEELEGVVVVAATNRKDLIDTAILRPGRFDLIIDFPVPDEAGREEIFKVHTARKPLAKDVDLKSLAQESEGLVGSDIEAIVREASMMAIREYLEAGSKAKEVTIKMGHFNQAGTLVKNRRVL